MGIESNHVLLEQLRSLGVKHIAFDKGDVVHIEFFPKAQPVQTSSLPMIDDMPPDDVMMFAATPTFDEMIDAANKKD